MKLNEYQQLAAETDRYPYDASDNSELSRARLIPLLGLVGEVGSLLVEYKKQLRDGPVHSRFRDQLSEELGDILWYLANVATKADLRLEDIARQNLDKTSDRWNRPKRRYLYDDDCPEDQRLPRVFAYRFLHCEIEGRRKLCIIDILDGTATGDPLTDNSYEDDGYRYHDAMHFAFAACLGWSPVLRKVLRTRKKIVKRFTHEEGEDARMKEDAEDGGRAQVIEEAIVASAYVYDSQHPGATTLDWRLLRHIKELTSGIEVSSRSEGEWETALLQGYNVWNMLRQNGGGLVRGDLHKGTISFETHQEAKSNDV